MRLGILGSGQLAKLLAYAARMHGHDVHVFASDRNEPAHDIAHHVFLGNLDDEHALRIFFSHVDAVIFENEFIDLDAIRAAATDLPVKCFPSAEIIYRLSDKIAQKEILHTLGIPTADAEILSSLRSKDELHEIISRWNNSCVLKWSRFGYDGKGVYVINGDKPFDLDRAFGFCEEAFTRGAAILVEERISFSDELAMVSVRAKNGEFAHYPLVISRQEHGVCKDVIGPASSFLKLGDTEKMLAHHMQRFAEHMGIIGAFAFEFFLTTHGDVLVNEIAPRVHNSAHYTLDACMQSQFDNHIRAITGDALDTTTTTPFFAMRNLLGPALVSRNITMPSTSPSPSMALHWYDKHETRPLRKLGHLNVCAANLDELEALTECMIDYEARWLTEILTQKEMS